MPERPHQRLAIASYRACTRGVDALAIERIYYRLAMFEIKVRCDTRALYAALDDCDYCIRNLGKVAHHRE
jgi:hypothetical protein